MSFACYSTFLLTLNNNKAGEEADVPHMLSQFKEETKELFDEDSTVYREVFGDPDLVMAKLKNLEAEVGDKKHRLHFHATIELEHDVPRYSGNKLATRLLNYLNTELKDWIPPNSSWYINLKVVGADVNGVKNYVTKQKRRKLELKYGMQKDRTAAFTWNDPEIDR